VRSRGKKKPEEGVKEIGVHGGNENGKECVDRILAKGKEDSYNFFSD